MVPPLGKPWSASLISTLIELFGFDKNLGAVLLQFIYHTHRLDLRHDFLGVSSVQTRIKHLRVGRCQFRDDKNEKTDQRQK